MREVNHLELILKLAARCNIDCHYCYYFKGGDKDWRSKDKRMSFEVLSKTFSLIENSIREHKLKSLQVDFHGGEPLLYGKQNLEKLCQAFVQRLGHKLKLQFAIQTNAILIDEQWIDIFAKYNIAVSVSLDGPQEVNDQFRVTHKGEGTFEKTLQGIQKLQMAKQSDYISDFSVLAVINPNAEGGKVYRYLVDELQVKSLDFLLPSTFNEEVPRVDLEGITRYLLSAWEQWLSDNNSQIRIRFFDALFASLGGNHGYIFPANKYADSKIVAMTIDADGKIYGDDSLRANMGWKTVKPLHVDKHTLNDFLHSQQAWYEKHIRLPSHCKGCTWANVCQGGQLEHRYRERNGFNNSSVYCQSLYEMYNAVVSFLYINGLSQARIKQILQ